MSSTKKKNKKQKKTIKYAAAAELSECNVRHSKDTYVTALRLTSPIDVSRRSQGVLLHLPNALYHPPSVSCRSSEGCTPAQKYRPPKNRRRAVLRNDNTAVWNILPPSGQPATLIRYHSALRCTTAAGLLMIC